MPSRGSRPERHGRAAEASRRVYRALTRAYSEDLREKYGEEMVRCFGDLCRDELRSRGPKGLAAVWARALPDLVFTALKERNNMLARNAYLPVHPTVAARLGGVSALVGGACGVVAYYLGISFVVLLLCGLLSTFGLFGLYGTLATPSGRPGRLATAGAVLALASVGSWLALGVFGALTLAWEWAIGPTHVAAAAALCCWFVGLLLLGVAALRARLPRRLRVLPLTVVALVPVSLFLPAFVSFGMPLVTSLPFLGSALLGLVMFQNRGTVADAAPVPVAGGAATGGRSMARRVTEIVPQAAGRAWALRDTPAQEAAKEKELLEALGRHGGLTVARAALETSLTVEEAERKLSALAAKGHLEVSVERGRLLYSLWEGDAPL